MANESESRLAAAISKARGDIRSDEDMKANIDFLNEKAAQIKHLTPTENNDVRHKAAGNLAFLLSVIRCGETLHADEEANVRAIIDELELQSDFTKHLMARHSEVCKAAWATLNAIPSGNPLSAELRALEKALNRKYGDKLEAGETR